MTLLAETSLAIKHDKPAYAQLELDWISATYKSVALIYIHLYDRRVTMSAPRGAFVNEEYRGLSVEACGAFGSVLATTPCCRAMPRRAAPSVWHHCCCSCSIDQSSAAAFPHPHPYPSHAGRLSLRLLLLRPLQRSSRN